ncbi:cytochrome c oxidase cbb3-type subunit 4 [Loktanella fryxellensis]|uniref:Cytochrome c oxidase cbb3-type subunit 4 n=1 Tax=Loktanella fryxellensis TaxID=245187 RepID=A0A1H8HKS4_9RHOB|nr:cbb3-type cytochrome c oxidase subunit 3 [Loktanella fryxellensis]SEN56158.1 cytochrome c oxidase cbb3-type subunit 4 [Loktanella fryxellensis]
MTHDWCVMMSKSFGLFWLVGLSVVTTAHVFWPSPGPRFDTAANSIPDDADEPAPPVATGSEAGS